MPSAQPMGNMTEAQIEAWVNEMEVGCHAWTPLLSTSYDYVPSFAAGVIFCVLFGIPLLYHTFQSCRVRKATSILLALGAVSWASRTWSAKCPYNSDAFLAQEVTLIIAPVFFSAALYVVLGILIVDIGRASSFLSAKWYTIIFCTCDVISLVVQAVGGAMASTADTDADETQGTHIMVAGIAFQLGTMTLFGLMLADFIRRVHSTRLGMRGDFTGRLKLLLLAILVSFLMIYTRSIYRTIELAQGWNGYLISHEGYFIGLDAAIMVIAVAVFIPLDPVMLMKGPKYTVTKQVAGTDTSDGELAFQMGPYNGENTSHEASGARY
ncbi:hypothetical protein VMCG_08838 [Cytospora schulzeri]|uniref:RTA1 domain protein n=1 Tax=Cytospora schulzeri TaxID=448051 RepID=A0A423VUK0_9PEZI|nr:hypothetical protein VMCG_08838 [Valsa malicola]